GRLLVHVLVVAAVAQVRAAGHLARRHAHGHAGAAQALHTVVVHGPIVAEVGTPEALNLEEVVNTEARVAFGFGHDGARRDLPAIRRLHVLILVAAHGAQVGHAMHAVLGNRKLHR